MRRILNYISWAPGSSVRSTSTAKRTSDTRRWLIASLAVAIASLTVAVTAATWSSVLADGSTGGGTGTGGTGGTGGSGGQDPEIQVLDDLGLAAQVLSLDSIGASALLTVHATGLGDDGVDTVQVLVSHDPAVTAVRSAECVGEFNGAFSPTDAAVLDDGTGSVFTCFQQSPVTGDPGAVIEIEIERIGFGADEVVISGEGTFATSFFSSGNAISPGLPGPITVLNVAAPPTVAPTATPTNSPPPPPPPAPPPPAPPPPVSQAPGVPLNVETEAGDQNAIVRWEPPENQGSSPVLNYTVGIVGQPVVQVLSATARSTVFGGLTNGETIQLRVRATNAAGNGPYSAGVDVTPAGRPGAPGSVTAELLEDGASIQVQWQAPEFTNGADIDSFTVEALNGGPEPVIVGGNETTHIFHDLSPGTYSFTVTATSAGGTSDPSEPTGEIEITEPVTSGAPDEPGPAGPGPTRGNTTVGSSVQLDDSEVEDLAGALGTDTPDSTGTNRVAELRSNGNEISLALPVTARDETDLSTADLSFSSNALNLSFQAGSGTIEMVLSQQLTLHGTGSLQQDTDHVSVMVDRLWLEFAPSMQMPSAQPAGNIQFAVDLNDVPGPGTLVATPVDSFTDLDIPGDPPLVNPMSPNGELFGTSADDLALLVSVQLESLGPELFGNNVVAIEVDPAWLAAHGAAGDMVILFKISDAGIVYASEPSCDAAMSGVSVCTASFEGEAGGFSSFGLLATRRPPTPTSAPILDVATPAPQPTATPVPATPPVSGSAPTPPPGPATPTSAAATSTVTPIETPTPAPVITPTPLLSLGTGDGDGSLQLIVIVAVVGGVPLVVGGVVLYRRRRASSLMGILLIALLATQVFNGPAEQASAVDADFQAINQRPRLDGPLTWLNEVAFAGSSVRNSSPATPQSQLVPLFPSTQDGLVRISALSTDPDLLLTELEGLGMRDSLVSGTTVSGRLPINAVPLLSGLDHLTSVRTDGAQTRGGLTTTQGDAAHHSDDVRAEFGVDGTGLTIGVISDSYNCLGGAAADIANGDLPAAGVVEYSSPASCDGMTDEGRAMLQIIHDIAPGASLAFASGINGQTDMANQISILRPVVDIIVDDIGYFAEPYFQDGEIARAVDNAASSDVIYVSSAGNAATQSYEDDYRPGPVFPIDNFPSTASAPRFFGGTAHDFDPGPDVDWLQQVELPTGPINIAFQWDDNFLSLWNGSGVGFLPAESELDIYLFDETGSFVVGGSTFLSQGTDPFEAIQLLNTGPELTVNIAIFYDGGPVPGRLKYIHFTPLEINEYDTASPTVFGHSNAQGAIAVGAASYSQTPEFGTDPPVLETFSSKGGLPILRDFSGSPINPLVRPRPDIVAADGVNTTFFGQDVDSDGFPNFFGTSASAPHIAAIAALIRQADPTLTNEEVRSLLKASATDMGAPGYDLETGSGFVNAHTAVDFVAAPTGLDELTELELLVNDLVMEANNRFAWVSVETGHTEFETGILRIDSETKQVVSGWETPYEPSVIALSDDASVIYVGEATGNTVRRYSTSTGVEDQAMSLGMADANTEMIPLDMRVKPGDPNVLVAVPGHPNSSSAGRGAIVFENGVALPDVVIDRRDIRKIHFLPGNSNQLYGVEAGSRPLFWLLEITPTGIEEVDWRSDIVGPPIDGFKDIEGTLVFAGGKILDSATWPPTDLGSIEGRGVSEPDATTGRAYSAEWNGSDHFVEIAVSSLATLEQIDLIEVDIDGPPFRVEPRGIERWGSSGLVFFDPEETGLFFFESHRVGPDVSSVTYSDSALSFSALAGGAGQVRQLVVTNDGPLPVDFGNTIITGDDWPLFHVSDDQCSPQPLAVGNSCTIEVTFSPEAAGNFTATLSVVSNGIRAIDTFELTGIGVEPVSPNSVTFLGLETNDLVYDPFSNSLFASSNTLEGDFSDSVLQVDPATGLVLTEIETGPRTDALAISDDGQKLYVGVMDEGKLKRVDVPTGLIDFEADLGTIGSPPAPVNPQDLEVVPGDPSMVVASTRRHDDPGFEEVAAFKDGVKLPAIINTHSGPGRITFSDDPGLLYGFNIASTGWEFFRLSVDSGGVSEIDRTGQLLRDFKEDIHFEDGLVYSPKGRIIDPTVPEIVGEFPGFEHPTGGPVRPEADEGKVYYLLNVGGDERGNSWSDGTWEIAIFDIDTLERIGTIPVGTLNEEPLGSVRVGDLVRWGADGLAFRTNGGELVLVRSDEIGSGPSTVSGEVYLFGRLDSAMRVPDGQGTISATDQFGVTIGGPINQDGTYSLDVPAGPNRFRLNVAGFISAESGPISVPPEPLELNSIVLLAGDTNGDEVIDATDASNIANAFGSTLSQADALSDDGGNLVDIDWDNAVTGRDASFMVRNFGLAGTLPWQAVDPPPPPTPTPTSTPSPTATPEPTATPTPEPTSTPGPIPEGAETIAYYDCFDLESGTVVGHDIDCDLSYDFFFAFSALTIPHTFVSHNQGQPVEVALSPEQFGEVTFEDIGELTFTTDLILEPFNSVTVLKTAEGNYYKLGPHSEDPVNLTVTFEWNQLSE